MISGDSQERVAFDLMEKIDGQTELSDEYIKDPKAYYFKLYAECLNVVQRKTQ